MLLSLFFSSRGVAFLRAGGFLSSKAKRIQGIKIDGALPSPSPPPFYFCILIVSPPPASWRGAKRVGSGGVFPMGSKPKLASPAVLLLLAELANAGLLVSTAGAPHLLSRI